MSNKAIIALIVAVIIIGGIVYWASNSNKDGTTYTPTPVVTEPNPTPNPSNPNPPAKQPGVPVISTKGTSFVSKSSAVLNGEVNPSGSQTSYWYEYGTTNSFGSSSATQLIGAGYITYSAPTGINGLSASTTYYYRLVAQNQYGKVYGTASSFVTTNTPPPAYVPPTAETKSATSITQTSAVMNGVTNPHGATTYYWFEYGSNPSLGNSTASGSAGLGTSSQAFSFTLSSLNPNTTYYYRFDAQNGYGTVTGNIMSFTTKSSNPVPPQGSAPSTTTISASNISKDGATVNGQVNPNGSQTTYHFEYGKSTLFGLFTLNQKTDDKSVGVGKSITSVANAISGLDNDSTYYFQLIATNQYGTSYGAVYSFTTKK